jgi:3-dehydroquinate synthetase
VLNLGHTFGHAFELVSAYQLRHGEAVAIGIVAAANLSHSLKLCDANLVTRIRNLLNKWQLPTKISGYSADRIYDAMTHDKKRVDQHLRIVVPKAIGHVDVVPIDSRQSIINAIVSVHGVGW